MKIEIIGVTEVIKKLQGLSSSLESKVHLLMERLAEIGITEATVNFQNAQYDGTNDVEVDQSPQWENDNTLVIRASGETVLFIEFGTGIVYSEQHPKAAELGMIRGSYGQGKGNRRAWGYYGEPGTNGRYAHTTARGDVYITKGNPASRAMFNAGEQMKESVTRIAREVFKL